MPILSAQAQNLKISVKKGFIGRPWSVRDVNIEYIIPVNCVILLTLINEGFLVS